MIAMFIMIVKVIMIVIIIGLGIIMVGVIMIGWIKGMRLMRVELVTGSW